MKGIGWAVFRLWKAWGSIQRKPNEFCARRFPSAKPGIREVEGLEEAYPKIPHIKGSSSGAVQELEPRRSGFAFAH